MLFFYFSKAFLSLQEPDGPTTTYICMTSILKATGLTKHFSRDGAPKVEALRGVDLEIFEGEFVAITGPSGCGKSTLLTVLSGLDLPTAGTVELDGETITSMTETELAGLRNSKMGFVFQSFHLVSSLSALENVAFPAELAGQSDAVPRASELLSRLGLQDRAKSMPHQLSGGEKQRVAICRALINRPPIIFADEPTGNLDSENGELVLRELRALQREQNSSLVLVSHSAELVETADRTIVMKDGLVVL